MQDPLIHGRFREDKLGTDRWAVEFYSYTAGTLTIIVDHLPDRDAAIAVRNNLNGASGVTAQINSRKQRQGDNS